MLTRDVVRDKNNTDIDRLPPSQITHVQVETKERSGSLLRRANNRQGSANVSSQPVEIAEMDRDHQRTAAGHHIMRWHV